MRLFPNRTHAKPDCGGAWCFWRWFDITKNGETYLTRLTILRTPWFQVLLHWIHKPDEDDALHDHPWAFLAFLLRGRYVEERWELTPCQRAILNSYMGVKRWVNCIGTRDAHRIVEVDGTVVTLLFTSTKLKSWSFFQEDERIGGPVRYTKKTPWREFLGLS